MSWKSDIFPQLYIVQFLELSRFTFLLRVDISALSDRLTSPQQH